MNLGYWQVILNQDLDLCTTLTSVVIFGKGSLLLFTKTCIVTVTYFLKKKEVSYIQYLDLFLPPDMIVFDVHDYDLH